MGAHAGTNIADDGIVFAFDQANSRSWRGKPTTNIVSNPVPSSNTSGFSASGGGGTVTYDAEHKALKWVRTSYSTWGAYLNIYPSFTGTLDDTVPYTLSFEWKTDNTDIADSSYSHQLVQGNGQSAAMGRTGLLPNSVLLSNGWYRFTRTQIPNNTGVSSAYNRAFIGNKSTRVSTFYIRNIQFEKQGFRTPFVAGTRTTTDSIVDLIGNNTITIGNLSYNSDNTFEFDGVDDYFTANINHSYLNSSSLEVILNFNSIPANTKQLIFGYYHNPEYSNPTVGSIYTTGSDFRATVITTSQTYRTVSDASLGTISTGQLYHVIFTKDTQTGEMKIYRNGLLGGTLSFDAATYAQWSSVGNFIGQNKLDIGRSSNNNTNQGWVNYLDGSIYSAKVYNRILSAAEVMQNYQAIRPQFD